ncbi:MAG: helix-turn-helix transcriptional regulator [Candidatus Gastranaerophilales bacterium]|nr:helix-turn-helix transcriptional regulator [Candidatus Gastranaerophilales bacterium]
MFNLGEKLKQAREEAGLEQKTVASALNLDQGKISLIEKNARKVDAEKELPKFAKLFNKPISWFYEDLQEVPKEQSSVDSFLNTYFNEYKFNDIQKKKIEKILQKSLNIYLEDILDDEDEREAKHG